jgi:hypothetical protein
MGSRRGDPYCGKKNKKIKNINFRLNKNKKF